MFRSQKFLLILISFLLITNVTYKHAYSEESNISTVLQQMKKLQSDIKTLEKRFTVLAL